MATSPTQLSLRHLRADGWIADKVEQRIPRTNTTRDLFTIGDIIAIRNGETLLVQTTSYTNTAARVRKIAEAEHIGAIREAGWAIHVHGWRKHPRTGRWTPRIIDCS